MPSGATGTSFTVDPDRTAIIKCVTVHNHSGVATSVTLQVRTSGGSIRTYWAQALAIGEALILNNLFIVVPEGGTIHCLRGAAGTVSYTCSGALLSGDSA